MAAFTDKMAGALGHYAKHGSKVNAYRSTYNCENMIPRTVRREAWELFRHPLMAQALETMRATAAAKLNIDAAWVLERASRIADFNLNAFIVVDEHGKAWYDFSDATDNDWYCISEFTVDVVEKGAGADRYEVEKTKIKTESKAKALELVGKHTAVRAYVDRHEVSGLDGAPLIPRTLNDFYADSEAADSATADA